MSLFVTVVTLSEPDSESDDDTHNVVDRPSQSSSAASVNHAGYLGSSAELGGLTRASCQLAAAFQSRHASRSPVAALAHRTSLSLEWQVV